jgi:hypothetical protein
MKITWLKPGYFYVMKKFLIMEMKEGVTLVIARQKEKAKTLSQYGVTPFDITNGVRELLTIGSL